MFCQLISDYKNCDFLSNKQSNLIHNMLIVFNNHFITLCLFVCFTRDKRHCQCLIFRCYISKINFFKESVNKLFRLKIFVCFRLYNLRLLVYVWQGKLFFSINRKMLKKSLKFKYLKPK